MPLITKKNGRFRGQWTYAVPQEQRRTPTPSQEIRLARLAAFEERASGAARDEAVAEERRAALR